MLILTTSLISELILRASAYALLTALRGIAREKKRPLSTVLLPVSFLVACGAGDTHICFQQTSNFTEPSIRMPSDFDLEITCRPLGMVEHALRISYQYIVANVGPEN